MSIYIGNDLEDRLEALEIDNTSLKKYNLKDRLRALETENASLRKCNEYHQFVHEIDHMSDLHLDSSFYKQSMDIDKYFKIKKWYDYSIGQSTVIQQLDDKRPKLSNLNQTQNRRRYVNFENGSHLICSFNLNNPETTVCIAFRINGIASGTFLFLNGIIGNKNGESYAKQIAFYKTHSGLGLAISKAYNGLYVTVANDDSSFLFPHYRFPTQKSNCTIMNKWHVISVTWSNRKDLSNCWSNGEKLITFNTGNVKGSDHCFIGDLGIMPSNTYLTGCIGEIIGFYRSLTDKETSYIHKYLMKKWGDTADPI